MKIRVKRLVSILLVVIMLLGMSVTSFAAEESSGGESQPILRVPAPPITSITLVRKYWNKSEKCFEFTIKEQGIGPYSVTFNGTKLWAEGSKAIMSTSGNYAVGWYYYFKSPRIYSTGTYKMIATFNSTNGTPKIWTLKENFEVTEDMLQ